MKFWLIIAAALGVADAVALPAAASVNSDAALDASIKAKVLTRADLDLVKDFKPDETFLKFAKAFVSDDEVSPASPLQARGDISKRIDNGYCTRNIYGDDLHVDLTNYQAFHFGVGLFCYSLEGKQLEPLDAYPKDRVSTTFNWPGWHGRRKVLLQWRNMRRHHVKLGLSDAESCYKTLSEMIFTCLIEASGGDIRLFRGGSKFSANGAGQGQVSPSRS